MSNSLGLSVKTDVKYSIKQKCNIKTPKSTYQVLGHMYCLATRLSVIDLQARLLKLKQWLTVWKSINQINKTFKSFNFFSPP